MPKSLPKSPPPVLSFQPRTPAQRPRISHRLEDREDDLTWFYPAPERGRSTYCGFRGSQDVDEQIDYIISQHLGPWRTKSEFLRSAAGVLVRLVTEEGDNSLLLQAVRVTEAGFDVARLQLQQARLKSYFDSTLAHAQSLIADGHKVGARTYLRKFLADSKGVPGAAFRRARSRFWHRDEVKEIMGASWNGGEE